MDKKGLREIFTLVICFYFIVIYKDSNGQTGDWTTITNSGIIHRHENSFVELNGKFYLIGGRKLGLDKYVNIYDPSNGSWITSTKKPPIELHHFQGVAWNNKIYILGAFTGNFPDEIPTDKVYIYDPSTDTWEEGAAIPADRRRGSAGAIVHNNKIYVVGGATNGHQGGNVSWLDEYDPQTNSWTTLPDAPHARDHFQAVLNGNKLYLAGGRLTSFSTGHLNDLVVMEVDVYDFTSSTWTTFPNNIPTGRAGTASVILNNELIVIGGEGPFSSSLAHKETEAMDLSNKTWRTLAPLDTGRHATHAIVFNNNIYIAAGSKSKGGSNSSELVSMERFSFSASNPDELSMPAALAFDQVEQDDSELRTITILNPIGNNDITVQSITLANDLENSFFLVSSPTLPFTLTEGSSLLIEIRFKPLSAGEKSADLVVEHSGVNSPGTITLSGEGVLEVTGTDDALFNSVSIYPNPTQSHLNIQNLKGDFDWKVTTLNGIDLLTGKLYPTNHIIDIRNLEQGVYILNLKNNSATKSFLIKKD